MFQFSHINAIAHLNRRGGRTATLEMWVFLIFNVFFFCSLFPQDVLVRSKKKSALQPLEVVT